MHHAAAQDLHPPGALARSTPGPAADGARHVHFGRGFGEREKRRPEAHLDVGAEEAPGEMRQGRLEVDECDSLIHGESFDLRECRCMRCIEGIVPVGQARDHHAIRRRPRAHDAHLHGRGVRAHEDALALGTHGPLRVEIERVVHVEGGMIGREIQRAEIPLFRFRFGAECHGESEFTENPDDLVDDHGDGMECAGRGRAPGHGEIRRRGTRPTAGRCASSAPRAAEGRLEFSLEDVERHAPNERFSSIDRPRVP